MYTQQQMAARGETGTLFAVTVKFKHVLFGAPFVSAGVCIREERLVCVRQGERNSVWSGAFFGIFLVIYEEKGAYWKEKRFSTRLLTDCLGEQFENTLYSSEKACFYSETRKSLFWQRLVRDTCFVDSWQNSLLGNVLYLEGFPDE